MPYGSNRTLYNRWKRWSEGGVFFGILEGRSGGTAEPRTVLIDATNQKAHATAKSAGRATNISGWPKRIPSLDCSVTWDWALSVDNWITAAETNVSSVY